MQIVDTEKMKEQLKRPVKKWERRWVLQSNVVEYGCDIWVPKWVCLDTLTINVTAEKTTGVQYYEKVTGLS